MFLRYQYGDKWYVIDIDWTSATGNSIVFRSIVQTLMDKHHLDLESLTPLADELDCLVDKLYKLFYSFADDYKSIPYDPTFRRKIVKVVSELNLRSGEVENMCQPVYGPILSALFEMVLGKLWETSSVFLEDNVYYDRYRFRRRKLEQLVEPSSENQMTYEFEELLLKMTDLSRMLDCLTDHQRKRLVKHIFLKYTLKEIAEQENVSEVMIHKSVSSALNKLRQHLI